MTPIPQEIGQALAQVIADHGVELLHQPHRLRGFLMDYFPGAPRETRLLVTALQELGGARLSTLGEGPLSPQRLDLLSRRVADPSGLSPDLARWAIATWAQALGVEVAVAVLPVAPEPVEPESAPPEEELVREPPTATVQPAGSGWRKSAAVAAVVVAALATWHLFRPQPEPPPEPSAAPVGTGEAYHRPLSPPEEPSRSEPATETEEPEPDPPEPFPGPESEPSPPEDEVKPELPESPPDEPEPAPLAQVPPRPEGIAIEPPSPRELLVAAGEGALERGDPAGAVEIFEEVLRLWPGDLHAEVMLDESRSRLRREELAQLRAELRRSRSHGDKAGEERGARRILELSPADAEARQTRSRAIEEAAAAARRSDREEEVAEIWERVAKAWPGAPELEALRRDSFAELQGRLAVRRQDAKKEEPVSEPAPEPTPQDLRREALALLDPVLIPGGAFDLGCTAGDPDCREEERPASLARLTRPFRIASYETPNAAYRKCVEAEVCGLPEPARHFRDPQHARHPVVYVSWDDADTFCKWLGGRLPTEAEWEFVARGAILGQRFPFTDRDRLTHADANFDGRRGGTAPVGSYPADRRGVHDMLGNVREWVQDWYGRYDSKRRNDPRGPQRGSARIIRGGGWDQEESDQRVSRRQLAGPTTHKENLGFRCVLPAG